MLHRLELSTWADLTTRAPDRVRSWLDLESLLSELPFPLSRPHPNHGKGTRDSHTLASFSVSSVALATGLGAVSTRCSLFTPTRMRLPLKDGRPPSPARIGPPLSSARATQLCAPPRISRPVARTVCCFCWRTASVQARFGQNSPKILTLR